MNVGVDVGVTVGVTVCVTVLVAVNVGVVQLTDCEYPFGSVHEYIPSTRLM